MQVIKFLHLICGTTLLGITIASFFYISNSIKKKNPELIRYALRASFFGDGIFLICLSIQLITSNLLTGLLNFSMAIPWIFVAYHAFGLLIILWIINFIIKYFYLSKLSNFSASLKSFYVINIFMITVFIIIIHDAVMQNTWFNFLFKG